MKIKEGFVVEKVGNAYLAVAVGERADNFNALIHMNSTGAYIWEKLAERDMTEGELDYSYILEQLSKTGYDKYFGLEFFTFENREEKVWKSAKLVRRNRELRQQLAEYFAAHRNS